MANTKRRQTTGFNRGPVCRVCIKRNADEGNKICFQCRAILRGIDLYSVRSFRSEMIDAGIPVRGDR